MRGTAEVAKHVRLGLFVVLVSLLLAEHGSAGRKRSDPLGLQWVTVAHPGAPGSPFPTDIISGNWSGDQLLGRGFTSYSYRITLDPITFGQWVVFLNSVAAQGDPEGLVSVLALNGTTVSGSCSVTWRRGGGESARKGICYPATIQRSGSGTSSDPWVYSLTVGVWADVAYPFTSLGRAMRFANWVQNGRPGLAERAGQIGCMTSPCAGVVQDASSTEAGSYDVDLLDTDPNSVVRGSWDVGDVAIPNHHELHKAWFFRPAAYQLGADPLSFWDCWPNGIRDGTESAGACFPNEAVNDFFTFPGCPTDQDVPACEPGLPNCRCMTDIFDPHALIFSGERQPQFSTGATMPSHYEMGASNPSDPLFDLKPVGHGYAHYYPQGILPFHATNVGVRLGWVAERTETIANSDQATAGDERVLMRQNYLSPAGDSRATALTFAPPFAAGSNTGFRLVERLPEPSSQSFLGLGVVILTSRFTRRRSR
jgi:hypothetical protein